MPPSRPIVSPTGVLTHTDPAEQLARIAEIRAEALALPVGDEWEEMDRDTCLRYLAETEARLKDQTSNHLDRS